MRVALLLVALAGGATAQATNDRATYVLVHGAWGGRWDWRTMDSLLSAHGHRVERPQLTGLGERIHLASPAIDLKTHIDDVVNTILWDDLRDVILVGHSYGGMVVTGVADRIPERIRRIVYLDAFLPDSGESALGLAESNGMTWVRPMIRGDVVVPGWERDETRIPRDTPQPVRTLTDPLLLVNPAGRRVPATYILTVEPGRTPDDFQRFADRASARGWPVLQLQSDHVPERSAPAALLAMLLNVR